VTGVSEHVEDVGARVHFPDGSEVTAASARSVTMQVSLPSSCTVAVPGQQSGKHLIEASTHYVSHIQLLMRCGR